MGAVAVWQCGHQGGAAPAAGDSVSAHHAAHGSAEHSESTKWEIPAQTWAQMLSSEPTGLFDTRQKSQSNRLYTAIKMFVMNLITIESQVWKIENLTLQAKPLFF